VLLSGLLNSNVGRLVRDLRAGLGPSVELMGPDGLGPAGLLLRTAGPAARGMLVAYPGVITSQLPAAGRRFVGRFGPTQPGGTVELFAVYAAQATEVLLDAIARSDGTRSSVVDQLFRTRLHGTLIGDVAFDPRGDIAQGAVSVVRVVGRGRSTSIASEEGGVVERVLRLSPALVEAGPQG
jgi:branched-chain amino acid transport system substrate-binding protein